MPSLLNDLGRSLSSLTRTHLRSAKVIRLTVLALFVLAWACPDVQGQPPGGGGRGGRGGRGGPGGFGGGGFGGFGGGGFGGFGGGGGGIGGLLRDPAVKTEIQLTEEQDAEVKKIQDGAFDRDAMRANFAAIQEAKTEEERAQLSKKMQEDGAKKAKEVEAAIRKVLKPAQVTRLEQLSLQRSGFSALKDEEVAKSLNISDEQKKKVADIQADYDKKIAELREKGFQNVQPDEWTKVRTDRDAQFESVLTSDQRKVWDGKLGTIMPRPEGGPGGPGGDRGQRRERTGSGGGPRPPGREEKVPEGAVAVADFSAEPAESPMTETVPTEPAAPADKPVDKGTGGTDKLMSFKFRFAPWELVLKHFAEHAGLTLDLNVVPPGTFNYYDNGKYTVTQALDIINGYLLQKGYILVRRDKFLVVVTVDNIDPNLVPEVAFEDLPTRGRNELVSVLLPIEGMSPDTAADEAQELLGPQGKIVPLSKTGMLLITDITTNVMRIHKLLNGKNVIPTNGPTFQSFQLKHVSVMEAEKVVRDLFGLPQRGVVSTPVANANPSSSFRGFPGGDFSRGDFGRGDFGRGDFGRGSFGRGDFSRGGDSSSGSTPQAPQTQSSTNSSNVASNSRISVATDLRTNTLMVTAKADDIKIVEQAIKTLDIDEATNNQSRNLTGRNSPQLEVYPITTADPRVMIQTINNLVPSAIVNEDAKAKRLHVFATGDEQVQIKALIHQIDGGVEGGETALVVQLKKHDATGVAGSLRNLFKGTRDEVPMIEADPLGRRLMIRASTNQMSEIKQMLKGMGEDPDGTAPPDPTARGPIRTLSLGGRDPQEFAELIEKLWPNRDANPIRIVVPSAGNRTLKSGAHHAPTGEDAKTSSNADEDVRSAGVIKTKITSPIKVKSETKVPAAEKEAGALLKDLETLFDTKTIDDDLQEATIDDPAAAGEIQPAATAESDEEDPATEAPAKTEPAVEEKPEAKKSDAKEPKAGSTEKKAAATATETEESPVETKTEQPEEVPAVKAPVAGTQVKKNPASPQSGEQMPITILPSGNNLVITSKNLEALDELQAMIEALAQAAPKRQMWTVFYLRTADATETATMLGHLFPSGSVSQTTDPNSQTMMGSLTGGISSLGSSLMDMTGLSSLGAATALRIVPEIRSNALYVSGPSDLVHQVEDVLKVLDANELPESLRDRVPRMIPVEHAEVDEVAAIIESVYKDYMQAPAAIPGGGGGGINPLAMLMAASGGGDKQKGRGIRLTIGVDDRTNSIVVSSDETLYKQIETLVKTLDQSALEANRTIKVVSIDSAKAHLVQQALGSLMGKVKVSTTSGGQGAPGMPDQPSPFGGQGGGRGGFGGRGDRSSRDSGGGSQDDELRRRFLQGAGILPPGGGDSGGNNGGGRGGFGGGRGGFGGRRGGN